MESISDSNFQQMETPSSTKRKRSHDSDIEPGIRHKKPPARLQIELGYDGIELFGSFFQIIEIIDYSKCCSI